MSSFAQPALEDAGAFGNVAAPAPAPALFPHAAQTISLGPVTPANSAVPVLGDATGLGDAAKEDEEFLRSKGKVTVKDGKLVANHKTESNIKDPELSGKVAEGEVTEKGFSVGKDGPEANRSRTHTTKVDGNELTKTNSTKVNKDGVAHSFGNSKKIGDTTTSSNTSAKVGRKGASFEHGSETKTKDGGSSAKKIAGGYDAEKGTFNANGSYSAKSKAGNSVKAAGGATVDKNGNATAMNASFGGETKSGWSGSATADYKVDASKPKKVGDVYVVEWMRQLKGGVSGGKKGEGHSKLGGSGSIEANKRDYGTRQFKTEKEALAFQANAASMIGGAFGATTDVKSAMQMQIGETRGVGDGSKMAGELNASWGVADFNIGGEKSHDDAMMVERLSPTIFQVTKKHDEDSGDHRGMGVGGVGASGSESSGSSHSTTLQFDISTKEGKAAFELYQQTGAMPQAGAEKVSETDAKRARHGTHLSFSKAGSADFTSETWESVTRDKKGKRETYGGEGSQKIVSNIPFMKERNSAGIRVVQTEVNDRDRSYSLQGDVDSDDGEYSMRHLAQMTGTHMDKDQRKVDAAKASGKWQVDVNITPEQVDKFLGKVASEKSRDVGIFEKLATPDTRNNLRKQLQSAKSSDDKMRALSEFVAETHMDAKAFREMRDTIFGRIGGDWNPNSVLAGNFDYDLKLEKDPHGVFGGLEGRLEMEAKAKEYGQLMKDGEGSAGGPLVGSINKDVTELKRRQAALKDPKNYTDLPPELRAMQETKLQHELDQFLALRATASREGLRETGEAAQHEEPSKDPKVNQLRDLRQKLFSADSGVGMYRKDCADMRDDIVKNYSDRLNNLRSAEYHRVLKPYQNATKMIEEAEKMMPAIDEQRTQFLLAVNDPDKAIQIGSQMLKPVQRQETLFGTASMAYEDYHSFVTEPNEDQLDDDVKEALDQGRHPTSMTLPPEKPVNDNKKAKAKAGARKN